MRLERGKSHYPLPETYRAALSAFLKGRGIDYTLTKVTPQQMDEIQKRKAGDGPRSTYPRGIPTTYCIHPGRVIEFWPPPGAEYEIEFYEQQTLRRPIGFL